MQSFKLCYALTEVNRYKTGAKDSPYYRDSTTETTGTKQALLLETAHLENPSEAAKDTQTFDLSFSPSVLCGSLEIAGESIFNSNREVLVGKPYLNRRWKNSH